MTQSSRDTVAHRDETTGLHLAEIASFEKFVEEVQDLVNSWNIARIGTHTHIAAGKSSGSIFAVEFHFRQRYNQFFERWYPPPTGSFLELMVDSSPSRARKSRSSTGQWELPSTERTRQHHARSA